MGCVELVELRSEEIMASELERLSAIETSLNHVQLDLRDIKDILMKREEMCILHAKELAQQAAEIISIEKEIELSNVSIASLRNKVWGALIGAFIAMIGAAISMVSEHLMRR